MGEMDDAARLAAYDEFAAGVRDELEATKARMGELAAAGRVKSATYRQLFAARVTLREIDARLRERGLLIGDSPQFTDPGDPAVVYPSGVRMPLRR